jgi:hypothetical protein
MASEAKLVRLACNITEDSTGADEAYLNYNGERVRCFVCLRHTLRLRAIALLFILLLKALLSEQVVFPKLFVF